MLALRKFFLFLGKFFTIIFAVLFVITLTLVLILYGPSRLLFDSNLYKKALSDLDIYQKIPAFTSHFLPSNIILDPCADFRENCGNTPAGTPLPSFSIKLSPENWQALLEIFLPPQDIQTSIGAALDRFSLVMHGNANQIDIPIDMVKGNLTGTVGEQGLFRFFNSLPLCSTEETAKLGIPNPTSIIVPLCKPPDELLNLLIPDLLKQVKPYINRIPDGMNISMPASTLADIQLGLSSLAWILLLPMLFLLGVIWLGVRSLKSGLNLGGILLLISGLLALGVGLIFRFGAKAALDLFLGFQNTAIWTPELISFLRQLGAYLLNHLTDLMIYPSLILILIGLLVWIGSALIRKKAIEPVFRPPDAPVEGS